MTPFGHATQRDLKSKNYDLQPGKDLLELNKRAINQNSSIIMRDESAPSFNKIPKQANFELQKDLTF